MVGQMTLDDFFEIWEYEWHVTAEGDIIHLPTNFTIRSHDIAGTDWLSRMAEKNWVDMNTFYPAYREACHRKGYDNILPI